MKNNLLVSLGIAIGAALYEFVNNGINAMDFYKPIAIFIIALALTSFVNSPKSEPNTSQQPSD